MVCVFSKKYLSTFVDIYIIFRYKQCYEEALVFFGEVPLKERGITKDDRVHGALIINNELLRVSNGPWEKKCNFFKSLQPDRRRRCATDDFSKIHRFKTPFMDKRHQSRSNYYSSFDFDCDPKFVVASPQESAVCRQLLLDNYDEICDKIMEQKLSRSVYVQQTMFVILPRLAALNREIFVRKHLKNIMYYLLNFLRGKEKDRNMAFLTLGLIAAAVEKDIIAYVPRIMEVIKAALPQKDTPSKRKSPLDQSVFMCITLLAHAVKSGITQDVKEILDAMLSTGLNPPLTICLRELADNVPHVKRDISDGLLKMLSQVLMSKPAIQQQGTPKHIITAQLSSLTLTPETPTPSTATIVLALKTLVSFNFEERSLLQFVRRCADYFLTHEQQEIRLESVQICSKLLKLAIQSSKTVSDTLKETTLHTLEKLLVVGITDVDANVRLCVLRSLEETFDAQLAQPEFLNALLITLNDEVFEIREFAIIIIGRLSAINPAYVMPSVRKTLVQLLIELEHSGMSRNKEQSARMLDHLIVSTPKLISSYMKPILTILVQKLREPESNPGVVLNVLRAIGDLAEVNGGCNDMEIWADELLLILLEMLGDASSTEKRGVALWTMGQLVSSTGRVVKPYYKYPHLIDLLINFLKTEQQPTIRRETIRLLGLLGALDPYKHKMNKGMIDGQKDTTLISMTDFRNDEATDLSTAELLVNMGNMLDEYYPAVAISTLMKVLKDPTLSTHHLNVVQAVTFIFNSLGIKCVPYLSQVLPNLLANIRVAEMNLREFLFQQLSKLIEIVKQHIIGYMDDIFKLIKEFWTINTPLQSEYQLFYYLNYFYLFFFSIIAISKHIM